MVLYDDYALNFSMNNFNAIQKPIVLFANLARIGFDEKGLGARRLVLVGGVVLYVLWKNKKKVEDDGESDDNMSSDDFERGTGPQRHSDAKLASATNYFKDGHKIGQGGFGGVYRGFLKDLDYHVAIKRISKDSKQGKKEFASKVKIISQLRHRYVAIKRISKDSK
ncbi:hypothetical protein K1719_046119 [Acacia pycnantha]|nr:hypothetical protein K1719_046119 [Acacia pycnantha]